MFLLGRGRPAAAAGGVLGGGSGCVYAKCAAGTGYCPVRVCACVCVCVGGSSAAGQVRITRGAAGRRRKAHDPCCLPTFSRSAQPPCSLIVPTNSMKDKLQTLCSDIYYHCYCCYY
jgi:hypothetical protein